MHVKVLLSGLDRFAYEKLVTIMNLLSHLGVTHNYEYNSLSTQ